MNPEPTADMPEAKKEPLILPILPLRNTSLFPGVLIPLNVGRPASLRLLEESLPQSKLLGLVLQKDGDSENPGVGDLYEHGVTAKVGDREYSTQRRKGAKSQRFQDGSGDAREARTQRAGDNLRGTRRIER